MGTVSIRSIESAVRAYAFWFGLGAALAALVNIVVLSLRTLVDGRATLCLADVVGPAIDKLLYYVPASLKRPLMTSSQ